MKKGIPVSFGQNVGTIQGKATHCSTFMKPETD